MARYRAGWRAHVEAMLRACNATREKPVSTVTICVPRKCISALSENRCSQTPSLIIRPFMMKYANRNMSNASLRLDYGVHRKLSVVIVHE